MPQAKEKYEFWFGFIQATAAIIVTGLAIWGTFFFTLSEERENQLLTRVDKARGEAAAANSQVEVANALLVDVARRLTETEEKLQIEIAKHNAAISETFKWVSLETAVRSEVVSTLQSGEQFSTFQPWSAADLFSDVINENPELAPLVNKLEVSNPDIFTGVPVFVPDLTEQPQFDFGSTPPRN